MEPNCFSSGFVDVGILPGEYSNSFVGPTQSTQGVGKIVQSQTGGASWIDVAGVDSSTGDGMLSIHWALGESQQVCACRAPNLSISQP